MTMRLVTWNCRVGGFRKKAAHLAPFRPDILCVQEVEPVEQAAFDERWRPTYCDRTCAPGFPRRGLGVLSYTDTEIAALDASEPFTGFRRYEVRWNGLMFNVAGIWTWGTRLARTLFGSMAIDQGAPPSTQAALLFTGALNSPVVRLTSY